MFPRVHTTGKSVVNYVISPTDNFNLIEKKNLIKGKQWLYSEHRPLEFDIDFNIINHQNFENPVISSAPRPIIKRT